VEYRHNMMPTFPLGGAQISYDVVSGGGMWNWDVTRALSLTNAVRLDNLGLGRKGSVPPGYGLTNQAWDGRRLTEPSFNSGLVWRLDAADTLRLAAARGVQMPNLAELGGFLLPAPGGFVSGVPTLSPGIVTNVEAGWERALRFPGGRLRLSAYHETERDISSLSGGNDYAASLVSTPANIGNSEATGLELSLAGTFGKSGRWGASYTPEFISDHFKPGFTLVSTGVDFAHTTPVHVANANVGWTRGPWEADTYLRYESAFFGIEPTGVSLLGDRLTPIPSYVSVDARLGCKLNDRLTLSLAGQNIMLSRQRQTAAPDVERRVTLSVQARE
jgi:iron complex outermembrane receptor protein